MNDVFNPEYVSGVYSELDEATREHSEAARDLIAAKDNYDRWYSSAIAEGILVGKNDTERRGNAMIIKPKLFDEIRFCELAAEKTRCRLSLAQIREKEISRQYQLMELFQGKVIPALPEPWDNAARDGVGADYDMVEAPEDKGAGGLGLHKRVPLSGGN